MRRIEIDTKYLEPLNECDSSEVAVLDVQNPEIKVDDIMRRIQEKVSLRREVPPAAPDGTPLPALESGVPVESTLVVRQHLMQARQFADIGVAVPAMTRTHGIKRKIAGFVAKVFLRIAQLITRDQRLFNLEVLAALQAFIDRMTEQNAQVLQITGRLSREAKAARDEMVGRTKAITQELIGRASQDHAARTNAVAKDLSSVAKDLSSFLICRENGPPSGMPKPKGSFLAFVQLMNNGIL